MTIDNVARETMLDLNSVKRSRMIAARRKQLAHHWRKLRAASPEAARAVYRRCLAQRQAMLEQALAEAVCQGSA